MDETYFPKAFDPARRYRESFRIRQVTTDDRYDDDGFQYSFRLLKQSDRIRSSTFACACVAFLEPAVQDKYDDAKTDHFDHFSLVDPRL